MRTYDHQSCTSRTIDDPCSFHPMVFFGVFRVRISSPIAAPCLTKTYWKSKADADVVIAKISLRFWDSMLNSYNW